MLEGMASDQESASTAPPTIYRIQIKGRVPEAFGRSLHGFTVQTGPSTTLTGPSTTLTGPIVDTAALYGLIARLETLGLTLVSVHPVEHR